MEYEDRYVTTTPEGVSLDSVLAGLGSRFAAYLIDFAIQVAALVSVVVLGLLLGGPVRGGRTAPLIVDGAFYLFVVIDFVGYFVIFEMLWSGRSPGKRALGLRVVRVGGQPVGFWSSLLRNLLRVVDTAPVVVHRRLDPHPRDAEEPAARRHARPHRRRARAAGGRPDRRERVDDRRRLRAGTARPGRSLGTGVGPGAPRRRRLPAGSSSPRSWPTGT